MGSGCASKLLSRWFRVLVLTCSVVIILAVLCMIDVVVMLLSAIDLRGELWKLYQKVLVAESRIRSRRQVARVREWCREDVLVKGKGSVCGRFPNSLSQLTRP